MRVLREVALAAALLAAAGCGKKADRAPTAAEREAAAAAQVEKQMAKAAKQRADQAVNVAEKEQPLARDQLAATERKAEQTADRVGLDWKGPDESWSREWAAFATGRARTAEQGEYTVERNKDGSIATWARVEQVSGDAFAELRDTALATQVKAKLAADERTRALPIAVDADDHVVVLRGTVKDAREAGEAVRLALSTPGTERVVSQLSWK